MQTTKSKQKVLTRVSSTWKLAERNVNHYVIIIINSWRQFHAVNCLNLVNFVSQFVQKEKRYGQIEDTSETKRTATLTNISRWRIIKRANAYKKNLFPMQSFSVLKYVIFLAVSFLFLRELNSSQSALKQILHRKLEVFAQFLKAASSLVRSAIDYYAI